MTFKTLISEKNNIKVFSFLFILMLFSDFFMKLNNVNDLVYPFRYSAIIKIIFEIYILFNILQQGISKSFVYLILILISCFFVGQYFLVINSIFESDLLEEFLKGDIYHLNKYIYIILFVAVVKENTHKVELSKIIFKTIVLVLSINSLLIIAGLIFDINLFKSFPDSARFGYSGIFSKSGESVLLYLLISIFYYIRFLRGASILPVIYFVLIALLSGKKIAFLILPLFYLVHFCIQSKYRTVFRFLGVFTLTIIFLFKKSIIEFLVNCFPFWEPIFKEKGEWTVIFSTRDLNLYKTLNFINEYWSPVNYFFGGTDYNYLRIEIDPFDLFVFFGIIGGLAYLAFIRKCFFIVIDNYKIRLLIIGYIVIGMIYGAFLFNILLMSSLYLFIIFCNSSEKELTVLNT